MATTAPLTREKSMNKQLLNLCLVTISLITTNLAYAATNQVDFHTDAKLLKTSHGPVDKAYGYMNVVTDNDGDGFISVMFSNGSQIDWARFNADVKFLNAAGLVIMQEHFARRIKAANQEGAIEHKLVKPLKISSFDSIEVDFYMSDLPD